MVFIGWTNPQKRCFHRAISGFKVGSLKGEKVRFMTLTTSPLTVEGLTPVQRLELLQRDLRAFTRRIDREFGRFDYLSVRTLEGYGVVHILYRGSYIPKSWIVENWNELHGSFIVDVREPRGSSFDGARYVVSQYLSEQRIKNDNFDLKGRKLPDFIYGYSKDWVFKGFVGEWNRLKSFCYDRENYFFDKEKLISIWDKYLENKFKDKVKIFEIPLEVFNN